MDQENHGKPQITHDEMSNLEARRAFYGRPCPNHDLSCICVVRDARGSAVAALTWVLWKGPNRLQNLEATRRNISGPTSFQIFGKHLEECLRTGSKY